jgi:hypothetical protein
MKPAQAEFKNTGMWLRITKTSVLKTPFNKINGQRITTVTLTNPRKLWQSNASAKPSQKSERKEKEKVKLQNTSVQRAKLIRKPLSGKTEWEHFGELTTDTLTADQKTDLVRMMITWTVNDMPRHRIEGSMSVKARRHKCTTLLTLPLAKLSTGVQKIKSLGLCISCRQRNRSCVILLARLHLVTKSRMSLSWHSDSANWKS